MKINVKVVPLLLSTIFMFNGNWLGFISSRIPYTSKGEKTIIILHTIIIKYKLKSIATWLTIQGFN